MISKQVVLDLLISQLEQERATVAQSAHAAIEAATHAESRAEDQHDTRGLEASYLAGAQAHRAADLEQKIAHLRGMILRQFKASDRIEAGALVEVEHNKLKTIHFLLGMAGGMKVVINSQTVHVVTLHSPLGEELQGRKAGEVFEIESPTGAKEYEILRIS